MLPIGAARCSSTGHTDSGAVSAIVPTPVAFGSRDSRNREVVFSMPKVTVEIPEAYLLHIATYGGMGTGEFSDLMRIWAEKECVRLNLEKRLKEMQLAKLEKLRRDIGYNWGEKAGECIDSAIEAAKAAL